MARALINVPPKAGRGDIVEIKVLISHPMETGYRVGPRLIKVDLNELDAMARPIPTARGPG